MLLCWRGTCMPSCFLASPSCLNTYWCRRDWMRVRWLLRNDKHPKKGSADTCHAHGLQQTDLIQGMCPHLLASASASLSLPVFMMVT